MSDTISEKGVFVDSKTGKVVDGPVEEGVQLCPPAGVITPDVQQRIDLAKAQADENGDDEVAAVGRGRRKKAADDDAEVAAVGRGRRKKAADDDAE